MCCSSRASLGWSGLIDLCYFPVSAMSPALEPSTSRDIKLWPPRARRSWCYPTQTPDCSSLWAAKMVQPVGLWQQQVTFLPVSAPLPRQERCKGDEWGKLKAVSRF